MIKTKHLFLLSLLLFINAFSTLAANGLVRRASGLALAALSTHSFYECLKKSYDVKATLREEEALADQKETPHEKFWAMNARYFKIGGSMLGELVGFSLLMPELNTDAYFTGFMTTLGLNTLFVSLGLYHQIRPHNLASLGLIAINTGLGFSFFYESLKHLFDESGLAAFAAVSAQKISSLTPQQKKQIFTYFAIISSYIAIQNT